MHSLPPQALYDGEGKSVSIATSSENRLKNRFANICVCKYIDMWTTHSLCTVYIHGMRYVLHVYISYLHDCICVIITTINCLR